LQQKGTQETAADIIFDDSEAISSPTCQHSSAAPPQPVAQIVTPRQYANTLDRSLSGMDQRQHRVDVHCIAAMCHADISPECSSLQ
jgi:hypothetical protein